MFHRVMQSKNPGILARCAVPTKADKPVDEVHIAHEQFLELFRHLLVERQS